MPCTLTIRRVVLAFGVLLSIACGGLSVRQTAPPKDAAVATLDVLLFDGVKNVTAMTAGPDGNLWLATSDGTIARLTMAGQIDVFPIGLWASGGTTLARGPDGYLWLGNYSCSECSLARVGTDGTVTEVLVEQDLRPVDYLTNAPDGSVWFSGGYLRGEGGLGHITANGVERARTFTRVDCIGSTLALAMDPDGNAWLSVQGRVLGGDGYPCTELLRIAPDGQTTQHEACPGGTSKCTSDHCCEVPDSLVIGSDGNLWFRWGDAVPYRESVTGIVRMSPSGSPSYFTFGPSDRMTLGPDGNIWSSFGASISRITPSGDRTYFRLPDGVIAQQIAAGPDGNLWLALKDGRVARVSL
jgi:streptogramin lyase